MSERDPTYKERLRDDFARIAFTEAVVRNIKLEQMDVVAKNIWQLADTMMAARNPPPAEGEKKDK